MIRYLVQSRDRIFVKDYGFLSFAKNMCKNIGKNIRKSLSGKYCQKLLDHGKNPVVNALKTSKRVIQKIAKATGDLIGSKITNKMTKVSKKLETVTNENDKEIPKQSYMSPEKRQEINDDLRLK